LGRTSSTKRCSKTALSAVGDVGILVKGAVLAGVVVALIPSVLLFAFAQRYFIEGITTGSFR
jgi:multiple sugar transport system permease protein